MMERFLAVPVPIIAVFVQGFTGIEDWGIATAFIGGVFTLSYVLEKAGYFELVRAKVLGSNGNTHRKGDGKVIANQTAMMATLTHMSQQHDQKLSSAFRHPEYQPDEEKNWGVESVILYQKDLIEAHTEMIEEMRRNTAATNRQADATLARVDALERLLGTMTTEFREVKDMLSTIIQKAS